MTKSRNALWSSQGESRGSMAHVAPSLLPLFEVTMEPRYIAECS